MPRTSWWLKLRKANGLRADRIKLFTGLSGGDFENIRKLVEDSGGACTQAMFEKQKQGGSSGLFAARVGLEVLKYERVVLCGIPMEATAHFNRPEPWADAIPSRQGWLEALPVLKGKVFSMSGWTRELLGAPQ